MPVVDPRPSHRDQVRMATGIVVTGLIGAIMAGVVGPIVLAILIGKIWGH